MAHETFGDYIAGLFERLSKVFGWISAAIIFIGFWAAVIFSVNVLYDDPKPWGQVGWIWLGMVGLFIAFALLVGALKGLGWLFLPRSVTEKMAHETLSDHSARLLERLWKIFGWISATLMFIAFWGAVIFSGYVLYNNPEPWVWVGLIWLGMVGLFIAFTLLVWTLIGLGGLFLPRSVTDKMFREKLDR